MSKEIRVVNVVAGVLGIESTAIQLQDRLTDDLGADSLEVLEVVMAIEAEFDIEIRDDGVDGLVTVKDFCTHVAEVLS